MEVLNSQRAEEGTERGRWGRSGGEEQTKRWIIPSKASGKISYYRKTKQWN